MTQQPTGDGRSLPKSLSNLVKKFVRQKTDGSTDWATAADVVQALAEVDQVTLAAGDYGRASVVNGITSGITLTFGSTNFFDATALATLPSAASAISIALPELRRVTVVSSALLATVTVGAAAAVTVANGASQTAHDSVSQGKASIYDVVPDTAPYWTKISGS